MTRPLIFGVLLSAGIQALPAPVQIYAPPTELAATISVDNGSDLQAALDRARPGDVISLRPGVTYTGNFVLPRKEGNRYITLRTAPSSGLPESGSRITPDHASKLAKIRSPNGRPAIRTAPGAHHWRLLLLEIGPTQGGAGDIVVLGDGTSAQVGEGRFPADLVIDRCYIHGDPGQGQKRGIALNSGTTTVIGSYISDIKAAGQDAQGIAGWSGPGPYHIENNYIEASGENILFGGAVPGGNGIVPSDIVVRRNHVTRPPEWKQQRWTVKNLFELKNARRVLVEGNLFEYNWADGQAGYAIVFTPRGERGAAPWSTIEDVTFRFNIVRHTAAVFNLSGRDDAGPSGTLRRVRIADNLIYGVDRSRWQGNGAFMQVGGAPAEIVVEHNTVVQSGNIITAYGGSREEPAVIERFVFRDNIAQHNANGVIAQGLAVGTASITAYFPGGVFMRNVMAGGRESRYPGDNLFPDVQTFREQFVNFEGHDFRLRPNSQFRRAASDGSDLGVRFTGLVRTLGPRAKEWLGLPSATAQR